MLHSQTHLRTRPISAGHLRAFEAVARHLNFRAAAEEMALTQSAVSRQIQALEDQVGVKLFRRKQRGVAFTEEGERLFRAADHAIQQLQDIAGRIRQADKPRAVTITASTGVMGLWLLPASRGCRNVCRTSTCAFAPAIS